MRCEPTLHGSDPPGRSDTQPPVGAATGPVGDLVRLARCQAQIDLAMGRALRRLRDLGGVARLGYARFADYARDRLGMTPRWAWQLIRLDRGLDGLPILSEALADGRLTTAKVLATLPMVTPETQAQWVEKARGLTVRELDAETKRLRGGGPDCPAADARHDDHGCRGGEVSAGMELPDDIEDAGDWVQLRAPAAVAHLHDYAIEIARRAVGFEAPVHQCVEHILAEFIAGFPGAVASWSDGATGVTGDRMASAGASAAGASGVHRAAGRDGARHDGPDPVVPGTATSTPAVRDPAGSDPAVPGGSSGSPETPPGSVEKGSARCPDLWSGADAESTTPIGLDRCLRRLVRLRQRWHCEMACLLRVVHERRLWRELGFSRLDHFCREVLGISPRLVYELIATDRALERLPRIHAACVSGRIGWSKARLLIRVARTDTQDAWLDRARLVTVKYLELEVARSQRERETNPSGWMLDGRPLPVTYVSPYSALSPVRPGAALAGQSGSAPDTCQLVKREFPPTGDVHGHATEAGAGVRTCSLHDSLAGASDALPHLPCVIRFWLPRATFDLWEAVDAGIATAAGRPTRPWQRLLVLLEHFLHTWDEDDRHQHAAQYQALSRDGWVCTVPGCLVRRGLEQHHIVFRSREGSDAPPNLTAMCASHHRHALHARGFIRCTGHAPDELQWWLPTGTFRGDVRVTLPPA